MGPAIQPTPPDIWSVLTAGLSLPAAVPANDTQRASAAPAAPKMSTLDWLTPKGDGERTQAVAARAGHLVALGIPIAEVTDICLLWNSRNTPPLDNDKIIRTCASIAKTDERNHPDRALRRLALAELGPPAPLFDVVDASVGAYLTAAPPPRRWLLDDFLPLGIAATVVAPGGVGKSQLLMQLAYSVATGAPLCGHWPVGEAGSVLMICAEDTAEEIHRRVYRIHQQVGSALGDAWADKLKAHLFVRSTAGQDTLLTRRGQGSAEVARTRIADRLSLTAGQLADLKLIILDPASRFRGGEENSNEDGTRFVEVLEYLVTQTGATILVAHHSGKGALNSKEGASQNDSRGASSLTDGVRWQMVLTTLRPTHKAFNALQATGVGHYLEASVVKTNYTPPQPVVFLRREADGYLQAVNAAAPTAGPSPALIALLKLIASNQNLTAKDIETQHCGPSKTIDIAQRISRGLIHFARGEGLVIGQGRQGLALTPAGQTMLAMQTSATKTVSTVATSSATSPAAVARRQTVALPPTTEKALKINSLAAATAATLPPKISMPTRT